MPNRPRPVRFVVTALSFAVLIALAAVPTLPTVAQDETARIDVPTNGQSIVGAVEVRGRAVTADPSHFSFYRLHYGQGAEASSLRPIGSPGDTPVEDGLLGVWDTTPLFQGEYLLQLTVYDTSGNTTTAQVVVNVLPAPTPTPQNRPSILIPVPGETPEPGEEEDTGPTATPIPELPQLVPNIPQIDVPQQPAAPPPIPQIDPGPVDPGLDPVQVDPGAPPQYPGAPAPPAPPQPAALPTVDFGPQSPSAPSFSPVGPVGPPPPPEVAPYVPPPTFPLPPTPTQFGLPP